MNRRWACALAAIVALATHAGRAHAQRRSDPARIRTEAVSPPRMPAPFVLPDLAHTGLVVQMDSIVGRLSPHAGLERTSTPSALVRPAVEANLFIRRRLYVGLAWPIGFAMPPDGGLAAGEATRPAGMRRLCFWVDGRSTPQRKKPRATRALIVPDGVRRTYP